MDIKKKAEAIIAELEAHYGDVKAELNYSNIFELTIAVVLSAQTTDKQVNKATPALFKQYPDFESLGKADTEKVEELIRSTGFYKNKAKNIIALGRQMSGRELPDTIDGLTLLPGIGRKTANVILSQGFGLPGFAVDTHVGRIARRTGLTTNTNPDKVEMDLKNLLPPERWLKSHLLLITHGRAICSSRSPRCSSCPISSLCSFEDKSL